MARPPEDNEPPRPPAIIDCGPNDRVDPERPLGGLALALFRIPGKSSGSDSSSVPDNRVGKAPPDWRPAKTPDFDAGGRTYFRLSLRAAPVSRKPFANGLLSIFNCVIWN